MNQEKKMDKNALLKQASVQLNEEYIGLEKVIEQIMHLLGNWYLYPQFQQKPVVINLWGMTGIGKTSLVKRIVELLKLDDIFFHFDMGNNSEHLSSIKEHLKELELQSEQKQIVFCFDEFQYANTIDAMEKELNKTYSRVVWDLLDSGCFQAQNSAGNNTARLITWYKNLKYLIEQGLKIENGVISEKTKLYAQISNWKIRYDSLEKSFDKKLFFCHDIVDELFEIMQNEFETSLQLVHYLKTINHQQTLEFIELAIQKSQARQTLNFSNSLIFIIGNLDEAYPFCAQLDTDIDADLFYDLSTKINITDIKEALRSRFKLEQIARLGNNHIIYPSFSKSHYEQLIQASLQKIAATFYSATKVTLHFTQAFTQLIYNEGVYPTQGCRPVLSTIQNLLEANLPQLYVWAGNKSTIRFITIDYQQPALLATCFNKLQQPLTKIPPLHIPLYTHQSNLSYSDDLQALIAVHEAGHTVAQMQLNQQIPLTVVSVAISNQASGFVLTEQAERQTVTLKQIKNKAAIMLSGYVAEYLLFSKDNLSIGSKTDIVSATQLIATAIRQQGLGGKPYLYIAPNSEKNAGIYESATENLLVQQWLDEATAIAEKVLQYQWPFLLQLAKQLSQQRKLTRSEIIKLKESGFWNPEPLGFEQSFSFKKQLELTIQNDMIQIEAQ